MESYNSCRLCSTELPPGTGIDIFSKPRPKESYSKDLSQLLKIYLVEKSNWPRHACKQCIDFIYNLKAFKEKIDVTQESLQESEHYQIKEEPVESRPKAQVVIPKKRGRGRPRKIPKPEIEEPIVEEAHEEFSQDNGENSFPEDTFDHDDSSDYFLPSPEPKEPPPIKEEVKEPSPPPKKRRGRPRKDKLDRPAKVPKIEKVDIPAGPIRRTSRPRKERSLPDDTVTKFDDLSSEEEVEVTASKVNDRQDAADASFQTLQEKMNERREQRDRKQRKAPEGTVETYDGASDDDVILRREERLATLKRPQSREIYRERLEKRFAQWEHLHPLMKELRMNVCNICNLETESFAELSYHMEGEHKVNRYQTYAFCCDQKLSAYEAYDHIRYHQDKDIWKCDFCGKQCITKTRLNHHRRRQHVNDADKTHQCPVCKKAFLQKYVMEQHKRKHDKYKFNCEECKRMFITEENLQSHIDHEHNNVPRHICDICGKGVKSLVLLKAHQKSHSQIKMISPCDICGLYFVDVAQHKLRSHDPQAFKNCEECGKKFSPRYYKRHMEMVHRVGNFKQYECEMCSRMFNNKDKLKLHMAIHLGIRWPCHFCPETYGAPRNRHKHMITRHPTEYAEYKIQQNLQKTNKYQVAPAPDGENNPPAIQLVVEMAGDDEMVVLEPQEIIEESPVDEGVKIEYIV